VTAQSFGHVDGWRAPSPRLLTLRRVEVGMTTLVLAVAGVVVAALGAVVWGLALLGAVIVLGALVERTLKRRFSGWGYLERADDLLVRRGVLFSRLSVVPYGRMQFVDVTAGPFERSFGLATVRLHTAAAASDARIPGLERTEAARVRGCTRSRPSCVVAR
jgi:membrane protein YdbS with pleckstrin-like domain